MKLKSYFSGTVEAAMELARKELGDEALLVNARPATPETRYLGAYEVVFGARRGRWRGPPGPQRARPGGSGKSSDQTGAARRGPLAGVRPSACRPSRPPHRPGPRPRSSHRR